MGERRLALVTGANGHLGRNLIPALLRKGWRVRASVRDASDEARTAHLVPLDLEGIVSLDVRDAGAFPEAARGVDVLFHVAATYRYHSRRREDAEALIADSLEGTRSAMAAARDAGVERVVMTSSAVTLPGARRGEPPPDETRWRTDLRVPYFRAKTEAERLAWRLAEEWGVRLVTLLPGGIIGPNFGEGTQSTDYVRAIMMRAQWIGTIRAVLPLVDVRDVVRAHLLAAERDVGGRFVVGADEPPTFPEIIRVMREIDRRVPRPLMVLPDFTHSVLPLYDRAFATLFGTPRTLTPALIASAGRDLLLADNSCAARELGWRPEIPLRRSLADTMAEMRDKGMVRA